MSGTDGGPRVSRLRLAVPFRGFDVIKPFPVRQLEKLPGGSGIMADDLMAGAYANLVLHALLAWALPA